VIQNTETKTLTKANLIIKDYPEDAGQEPSTPPGGNFWTYSDIVILKNLTTPIPFNPTDLTTAQIEYGQTNYLCVRVRNIGTDPATNVVVHAQLAAYVGLEFTGTDYRGENNDLQHITPNPVNNTITTLAPGATLIATFEITKEMTHRVKDWHTNHPWHPCALAYITADHIPNVLNPVVPVALNYHNHAQRNLTIVDYVPNQVHTYPFIVGNLHNMEHTVELTITMQDKPADLHAMLLIDEDPQYYPHIRTYETDQHDTTQYQDDTFVALDRVRFEVACEGRTGVLTLEKGSRLTLPQTTKLEPIHLHGATMTVQNRKRHIELHDTTTVIRLEKKPGRIYPIALQVRTPATMKTGQHHMIQIAQRNEHGDIVGGATVIYRTK